MKRGAAYPRIVRGHAPARPRTSSAAGSRGSCRHRMREARQVVRSRSKPTKPNRLERTKPNLRALARMVPLPAENYHSQVCAASRAFRWSVVVPPFQKAPCLELRKPRTHRCEEPACQGASDHSSGRVFRGSLRGARSQITSNAHFDRYI